MQGQNGTPGQRRGWLRSALAAVGALLTLLGLVIGALSTTPDTMAENWPRWLASGARMREAINSSGAAWWIIAIVGLFLMAGSILTSVLDFRMRSGSSQPAMSLHPPPSQPAAVALAEPVRAVPQLDRPSEPESETEPIVRVVRIAAEGGLTTDVDLDYVARVFREHTAMQADRLVEGYIGRWLACSGIVDNISVGRSQNEATLWLKDARMLEARPTAVPVMFVFAGPEQVSRLSSVRRGDRVTVLGRIEEISGLAIVVEDGRIVESWV